MATKRAKTLEAPKDPDALDEFFADAVYKVDRARIEAALAAGAKFEPDDGGQSVLMHACNSDNGLRPKDLARIALLLELGADPLYQAKKEKNRCALHELSFEPSLEALELLVKASKGKLRAYADDLGNTPLHYAAWHCKDLRYLERLIELGNPVDGKNARGDRPLHGAIDRENHKLITWLVERGASLEGTVAYAKNPKNQASPRTVPFLEKLISKKR